MNLAAVEAAELVAEAVSREPRDASSSERIQVKSWTEKTAVPH